MTNEHVVIIGNGIAANRAADIVRNENESIRISLISDEFSLFYRRYRLNQFVAGQITEEELVVNPVSYYKQRNIRLRLGQRVDAIDFKSKTLYLSHMEKVSFSHLLLCTGGRPHIPEIHYRYKHHFVTLKSVTDARYLKEQLKKVKKIVMIGGDLISVQMAITMAKMGFSIDFIVNSDSFWPLEFTDDLRQDFKKSLTHSGVNTIDDQLRNIEQTKDGQFKVTMSQKNTLECGMVCGFFGLRPNIDFLLGSGLDIDRGILVDDHLKTNISGVYAAGDCAQVYNPDIRNYWVSIGWENARNLGEIAARNMLGHSGHIDYPLSKAMECDGVKIKTAWWHSISI